LIELLRRAAAEDAARAAIVLDEGTTSYGELLSAAEACAAQLRARGLDRVAVKDPDAVTVVTLLAGASLAGTEVCQYPPTDTDEETAKLAERFDHDVLVTAGSAPSSMTILTPADLFQAGGPAPSEPPQTRPHLVLTTGTTGTPRGVRHDWNRILRGTRRIKPARDQRWLLAYGLHQFAGLQILVHVLAAGATLVAPQPRRPRTGLDAMRAHGVTHASATPTYWRFVLAEMRGDGGPVPQLEQITLGGEPIPESVLSDLAATFPDAHISQVYAANEFGSSGSMRDGRNGLSLSALNRGEEADIDLKIVDGELWVRSRVGMLGYYGEEPVDADAWRPTGDLVEVVGDRVYFQGRASEVINVGGVKVHPLPIEERIRAVEGVEIARVYGRPNPLTGAVVAAEIIAVRGAEQAELDAAVRAACADLPPEARPRSISFVETITMAGDKIARRAQ
jgi:acyl-CoA synthetase (AMP-forming)/AMP-acid ligase II